MSHLRFIRLAIEIADGVVRASSYRMANSIVPRNNGSNSQHGWDMELSQTIFHGFIGLGDLNFFRSSEYMEYAQFLNEDGPFPARVIGFWLCCDKSLTGCVYVRSYLRQSME